jgi:hypothetical protein
VDSLERFQWDDDYGLRAWNQPVTALAKWQERNNQPPTQDLCALLCVRFWVFPAAPSVRKTQAAISDPDLTLIQLPSCRPPTGARKLPSLNLGALVAVPVLPAFQPLLDTFNGFCQRKNLSSNQHITVAGRDQRVPVNAISGNGDLRH